MSEKDTQTLGQNKTPKERRGPGVIAVLSEGLAKPKLTDQAGVVSSGGGLLSSITVYTSLGAKPYN